MEEQPPHRDHRKNGVDRFHEEHLAEYEQRERERPVKLESLVQQHHCAYPKMTTELEKRRDMATPKILKKQPKTRVAAVRMENRAAAAQQKSIRPPCRACHQMKILSKLHELNLRPRCDKNITWQRKKTNKPVQRKKITKKKQPRHRKIPKKVMLGASPVLNIGSRRSGQKDAKRNVNKARKMPINGGDLSRRTSISSYHTFGSMAHEPMCWDM